MSHDLAPGRSLPGLLSLFTSPIPLGLNWPPYFSLTIPSKLPGLGPLQLFFSLEYYFPRNPHSLPHYFFRSLFKYHFSGLSLLFNKKNNSLLKSLFLSHQFMVHRALITTSAHFFFCPSLKPWLADSMKTDFVLFSLYSQYLPWPVFPHRKNSINIY